MSTTIDGHVSFYYDIFSLVCFVITKGGIAMYRLTKKRINMKNAVFTFVMAFVMRVVFNGFAYFTIMDLEDALALLMGYAFLLGRSIILSVPALETKWNNLKISANEKVEVLFPWTEVLILVGCSLFFMIIGFMFFQMIITV